ncbi:hypothetical protein PTKIN_Ptkin01aG0148900 [Pterospermum kingtungense]
MEIFKVHSRFANCLSVDNIGKCGGLALLWSKDIDLHICSYSSNYIDANVYDGEGGFIWSLGSVSWGFLCTLAQYNNLPWVCMGDFNQILSLSKKLEGARRPTQQMQKFYNAIVDCHLQEFPCKGHSLLGIEEMELI